MSTQKIKFIALFVSFLIFFTPMKSNLHAAILAFTFDNLDNTFTYNYIVDNSVGFFEIDSWSLEFDIVPDWNQSDTLSGGDVTVPNSDWVALAGVPNERLSAQDFLSFDPIAIGDTLPGFSFTSSFSPGDISFFEFSSLGESTSGITTGPVPTVPEPANWLLFSTLLLFSVVWFRKNQSRQAMMTQ